MLDLIRGLLPAIDALPVDQLDPRWVIGVLITVIGYLIRDHMRADAEVRQQLADARAEAKLDRGTIGDLSHAVEQDVGDRAGRRRRGDT